MLRNLQEVVKDLKDIGYVVSYEYFDSGEIVQCILTGNFNNITQTLIVEVIYSDNEPIVVIDNVYEETWFNMRKHIEDFIKKYY